jgi:hypothetical protein
VLGASSFLGSVSVTEARSFLSPRTLYHLDVLILV